MPGQLVGKACHPGRGRAGETRMISMWCQHHPTCHIGWHQLSGTLHIIDYHPICHSRVPSAEFYFLISENFHTIDGRVKVGGIQILFDSSETATPPQFWVRRFEAIFTAWHNGDLAMHGRTSEGRTSTREREGWAPAVLRCEIH